VRPLRPDEQPVQLGVLAFERRDPVRRVGGLLCGAGAGRGSRDQHRDDEDQARRGYRVTVTFW
jgi:hypothetical protein